jgi:HEAT repeat protein
MEKDKLKDILKNAGNWEARRDAAEELKKFKDDEDVLDALISALRGDDKWVVRFKSAQSLGDIGSKQAVKPLIKALKDPIPTVVQYAAEALGKIGDERAVKPLLSTLEYKEDFQPCEAAAQALAVFGERVVSPLIKCLKKEKKRSAAVIALGKIGDPKALDSLVGVLNDESLPPYVRVYAAEALGDLGDSRALEPLKNALEKSADQKLVNAITRAMEKLGAEKEKLGDMKKKADQKAGEKLLKNLSEIKIGMSEKEVTDLIGPPKFSMDSSSAFSIAGAKTPSSMKDKENWVYGSKVGDFQIVMDKGRVAQIQSVKGVINKLKKE